MLFHSLGASIRKKNGSDTPHQTTMNKLCRESVARCRECLTIRSQSLPNPHTDDPGQHSEISPLLSMVFFNFSAQEDQTVETHYSPRLPWPSGDMEVEVLLRGQHIYIPGICNQGAIRLCGPHPDGGQPRPAVSCGTPSRPVVRPGLVSLCFCTDAICMPRRR